VLGRAAHLEGLQANVLDQVGLSQKNGSVVSHIRISPSHAHPKAVRIGPASASMVMACDLVTTVLPPHLSCIKHESTDVVVNLHPEMPGYFQKTPELDFPQKEMLSVLEQAAGKQKVHACDLTALCEDLLGDSTFVNLMFLGYASQLGLLPVAQHSIERVIREGKMAVEANLNAFEWGRRAAHDLPQLLEFITRQARSRKQGAKELDHHTDNLLPHLTAQEARLKKFVSERKLLLASYQDNAYAERYEVLVSKISKAEQKLQTADLGEGLRMTEAVALGYAKALAYKDEYEVARLHLNGFIHQQLPSNSQGIKLTFHLAPPLLSPKDPATGYPRKIEVPGNLALPLFKILSSLKWVRGSALDVFGYTAERREERKLIRDYEKDVDWLLRKMPEGLTDWQYMCAIEILELPLHVKGFGHVKHSNLQEAMKRREELYRRFDDPTSLTISSLHERRATA